LIVQFNQVSTVNRLPVPSPICPRKKIQAQVKKLNKRRRKK